MLVEVKNSTRKLAVIGDPVGHSLSPLIQNTMIAELGLDYVYLAQFVARGNTKAWLEAAKVAGYAGFNATMPHKVDLVPLMDELDEDAALYQAVNTVCIREGRVYGHNTDGRGFVRAMEDMGFSPRGSRVTVLGAGGAANSVVRKLVQQGAERVIICNRTPAKAEELRAFAPEKIQVMGFTGEELRRAAGQAELLVNCTSMGMTGVAAQYEDLSFLEALPRESLAADLIYSPAETLFLHEVRSRGHQGVNGLGMLIYQAIFALEYFADVEIDSGRMKELLARKLELSGR